MGGGRRSEGDRRALIVATGAGSVVAVRTSCATIPSTDSVRPVPMVLPLRQSSQQLPASLPELW